MRPPNFRGLRHLHFDVGLQGESLNAPPEFQGIKTVADGDSLYALRPECAPRISGD